MKANATECGNESAINVGNGARKSQSPYRYTKVEDGRKQPIRGLWKRNGKFIARLSVEGADGQKRVQWVALEKAETIPQAVEELKKLHVDRSRDVLPVLKQTPKFAEYVTTYLNRIKGASQNPDGTNKEGGTRVKKLGTIAKETSTLTLWVDHLGGTRLDKIKPAQVSSFTDKRLQAGMSPRTVKLDVIALRNVLKDARDMDGHIRALPIPAGLNQRLKSTSKKRSLLTVESLDKVCESALAKNPDGSPVTENGQQFCDYVQLMAYCGARRNEALALRWPDVDFKREQITIGADGNTKNSTSRTVDFNPNLKALLTDMHKRRAPDTEWIFPSPQRGEKDIHAMSFRESLELVRTHAKLPTFTFHDCRHFFISFCVMSGVDFMTIAVWVGHRDGGVLIGKVYGHLADSHKKSQALRVVFGMAIVEDKSARVA